jgi:hypothetical protein
MRTSPKIYRLLQVLKWFETRAERARDRIRAGNTDDIIKAQKAIDRYTALDFQLNRLRNVTTYSDSD